MVYVYVYVRVGMGGGGGAVRSGSNLVQSDFNCPAYQC